MSTTVNDTAIHLIITNQKVYGMREAIHASGLPMALGFNYQHDTYAEDMVRAKRLGRLGGGHNNFLKGITVYVDLFCTQAILRQIQRYQFFTCISSMSLSHRGTELIKDEFLTQNIAPEYLKGLLNIKNNVELSNAIPMGMLLGGSYVTNYMCLLNIYTQRKNHRNPGWKVFCDWVLRLEGFAEITGVLDAKMPQV